MQLNCKVKELMSRELIIVEASEKLYKFKRNFKAKRIHHILVENQFDKLVGIISLDDVLKAENIATEYSITASLIMTPDPVVIQQEATVYQALELFLDNKYRALPVVDVDQRLVGIITPYDVMEYVYEIIEDTKETVIES